jgi:hypothetical protein
VQVHTTGVDRFELGRANLPLSVSQVIEFGIFSLIGDVFSFGSMGKTPD